MPEHITHKIRLSLSECSEEGGETLADDFYLMVSIASRNALKFQFAPSASF